MKTTRKELLTTAASDNTNTDVLIAKTLRADLKFLNRSQNELETQIEDLEEELETRLSDYTALDKSVVEVKFKQLQDKKEMLDLYKKFQKTFFSVEN